MGQWWDSGNLNWNEFSVLRHWFVRGTLFNFVLIRFTYYYNCHFSMKRVCLEGEYEN